MQDKWNIWIDAGGTFTDCIAKDPTGILRTTKVLSSGILRGLILSKINNHNYKVDIRYSFPPNFLSGYLLSEVGSEHSSKIKSLNSESGVITLHNEITLNVGSIIEISASEEAPILAARIVTGTLLDDQFPPMETRFGSTKGTNALLEGTGTPPVFITTKGFKDLLRLGNQQRPDIFQLAIQKPSPLHDTAIEIDERIQSNGTILKSLSGDDVIQGLSELKLDKAKPLAISLVNSYKYPAHELAIKKKLLQQGYQRISISHEINNDIKILPRAYATIVNAYLDPVISEYINSLRTAMGDDIKVMSSSGGMMNVTGFLPKDSLLSGPAGGVLGAAYSSSLSGYDKVITFDMGGTSTDVSRVDRQVEYIRTIKVGAAEISTLALNIQTVASGGGSICKVMHQKLSIGPESAGSHPGPACYGRGGPLTITDIYLLLGRMNHKSFQIPVNEELSRKAFQESTSSLQTITSEESLLMGFLEIANEKMAEAIRKISIRKGYNTSEYALTSFGGAGGLHACRIAEILNIRKIIIPQFTGLQSAFGMGVSAMEATRSMTIILPLEEVISNLSNLFHEISQEAIKELTSQGYAEAEISTRESIVHMRLQGQDEPIPVKWEGPESIEASFRESYIERYGHWIANRAIEVESILIVVQQNVTKSPDLASETRSYLPNHDGAIPSWVGERWMSIPIFQKENLKPGAMISGPAIISGNDSAVFIEPGWDWETDQHQNGILKYRSDYENVKVNNQEYHDVIDLELFINRFSNIAEAMGALLERTAFSVNIKERLDFSCAILDQNGILVTNAPHIPVHLGSLGICVRSVLAKHQLHKGDVIITNHPAFGGSHLPDITVIAPVFYNKQIVAYVANRCHHAEIGGLEPGSMPSQATTLEEEGVVIPPTLIIEKGEEKFNSIRKILAEAKLPSRSIMENMADLEASIAAINLGINQVRKLCSQFGPVVIQQYMAKIHQFAGKTALAFLEKMEDGRLEAIERLDDGSVLKLSIIVKNHRMIFDFTGSAGIHPGNLNATSAIVHSSILYVLRILINEPIPLNEGIMEPIEVILPTGMLNPDFNNAPSNCPAIAGGNTEVSQRLVDTILKAFNIAACSQGTMNNVVFGNNNYSYYETIGGGVGAIYGQAGADGVHQHMTNTRITDPEIIESRYPVLVNQFSIRKGTGGKGKYRGGNGIIRSLKFLEDVRLTILSQHRKEQPYGINGGANGATGTQRVIRADGTVEQIGGIDTLTIYKDDTFVIETPGGGGYEMED